MKKTLVAFVVGFLLAAATAYASTIKVWSSGERLLPSDLNDTFAHIHNTMVGGHGARLVNADVASAAAISQSKISGYAAFPKGWAFVAGPCTSSPCTISAQSGTVFSSIARLAAGRYSVTLSPVPVNALYGINITADSSAPATGKYGISCHTYDHGATTPAFYFRCVDVGQSAYGTVGDGGVVEVDTGFTITYWDDN